MFGCSITPVDVRFDPLLQEVVGRNYFEYVVPPGVRVVGVDAGTQPQRRWISVGWVVNVSGLFGNVLVSRGLHGGRYDRPYWLVTGAG